MIMSKSKSQSINKVYDKACDKGWAVMPVGLELTAFIFPSYLDSRFGVQ